MPDKLHVNEQLGIIEVRSFGEVSGADISGSIREIWRLSRELNIRKIVVDTTEQDTMPDILQLVGIFEDFPRDLKLALVARADQATSENVRTAKNVNMVNGVAVRDFNDWDKAVAWLNE